MRRDRALGLPRILRILTHILYAGVVGLGIWLIYSYMQVGLRVPAWMHLKIVLFVIAVVFSAFAFRPGATRNRQNLGMLLAGLAYIGVMYCVFAKPFSAAVAMAS